ncbi:MAG: ChaN family lipoprotein [Pseudomonadota bacterium]
MPYTEAQIVILGEVHDNPNHHDRQAELVAELQPKAIVFEMLQPSQVEVGLAVGTGDAARLEEAFGWEQAGWPDFAMYFPIFTAAPDAAWVGAALPPSQVRRSVMDGPVAVFGDEASAYGLDQPLAEDEQAEREAYQDDAHCNAMPASMMAGMVGAQRLRDASFARSALEALQEHGAPVVVIAGWGHAHHNWAMPRYIAARAPDVAVSAYGMVEEGYNATRDWSFDHVYVTPPTPRDDPCAAFKKQG